MDDYLSKPLTQEQLRTVLQRWLPQKSTGNEALREVPPVLMSPLSRRAVLDHTVLDSLRALQKESGRDILGKAIRSYLSTSPQLLQAMQEAVIHKDAEALHRAAHTLESSSVTLGAVALAALCEDLEAVGRANNTDDAATVLSTLKAEYEAVRVALARELEGDKR
jgi:HPt (histidine-containing phosphotransfer) domain-containing protein